MLEILYIRTLNSILGESNVRLVNFVITNLWTKNLFICLTATYIKRQCPYANKISCQQQICINYKTEKHAANKP